MTVNILHVLIEHIVHYFNEEVSGNKLSMNQSKISSSNSAQIRPVQVIQAAVSTSQDENDGNNQASNLSNYFSYTILIKTLHYILNKYPILIPLAIKHNVTKITKKTLKNPILLNRIHSLQNISFLNYMIRVVIYSTLDKFRPFIYGICTNNPILIEKTKGQPIPYAHEIRKKVISEIYSLFEEEFKNQPFYKTSESIRGVCSLSCLFFYLLPLKDIVKLSIKTEDTPNAFNFIKLFSEALKSIKHKNYYDLEHVIPFILGPYSILSQYHQYMVTHKDVMDNIKDEFMPKNALTNEKSFESTWLNLLNAQNTGDADEHVHHLQHHGPFRTAVLRIGGDGEESNNSSSGEDSILNDDEDDDIIEEEIEESEELEESWENNIPGHDAEGSGHYENISSNSRDHSPDHGNEAEYQSVNSEDDEWTDEEENNDDDDDEDDMSMSNEDADEANDLPEEDDEVSLTENEGSYSPEEEDENNDIIEESSEDDNEGDDDNSYISEDYYDSASDDEMMIVEPGQAELLAHFPASSAMPLPWENRRNLMNMPELNPEFARFRDLFISHHLQHPEFIRININLLNHSSHLDTPQQQQADALQTRSYYDTSAVEASNVSSSNNATTSVFDRIYHDLSQSQQHSHLPESDSNLNDSHNMIENILGGTNRRNMAIFSNDGGSLHVHHFGSINENTTGSMGRAGRTSLFEFLEHHGPRNFQTILDEFTGRRGARRNIIIIYIM